MAVTSFVTPDDAAERRRKRLGDSMATDGDATSSNGVEPQGRFDVFDQELASMDAVATADAITAGALTPVEVTAAAVRRCEIAGPALGAVVTPDYERALDAARTLRRRGGLAGVPTMIKDMVDVAGLPTQWGSDGYATAPPAKATTALAAQFEEMGAICLGKSSMPEFGFQPSNEPVGRPPTRNPWGMGHTTGGSSAGSAALVAAGALPIAHTVDGGGSTRIPAAACGLVGLKPTRGRLLPHPDEQILPVSVSVDGVATRTVRDTARFFAEAERIYRAKRLPEMGEVTGPARRRLTIAAAIDLPIDAPPDAPTRAVFDSTLALLESLGHRVEIVPTPVGVQFADDFVAYFQMLAFLKTRTVRISDGRYVQTDRFTRYTKGMADAFLADIGRGLRAARRLRGTAQTMADFHQRYDVVFTPTLTTVAPELGYLDNGLDADVIVDRLTRWMAYTPLANAAGTPSISLPLGSDPVSGLPVGMMFGAAHGDDATLLELSYELEAAAPWPTIAG